MKRRRSHFPTFVWLLLGLLALSAALLSLGQTDDRANPMADSFGPSGTSAFAQLLRQNGYRVRVDMRPRPRLEPDEVAIGFSVLNSSAQLSAREETYEDALIKQLKDGRKAIIFALPRDYQTISGPLLNGEPSVVAVRGSKQKFKLPISPFSERPYSPFESGESTSENDEDEVYTPPPTPKTKPPAIPQYPSVGLWQSNDDDVLRAFRVGKGTLLYLRDGIFVTNRFLDRAQSAQAALEVVGLLAPRGQAIVFTEASFGNVDPPGLLETIGAWADAAWQQCLFLLAVVIFTLGKRFGLPDESRPPQRGARELLEALTDTYTRGRQTRAAMLAALERINAELRTALRLPRDAARAERDRHLPSELSNALARLQTAAEMEEKTSPAQALELIRAARMRSNEFLGRK